MTATPETPAPESRLGRGREVPAKPTVPGWFTTLGARALTVVGLGLALLGVAMGRPIVVALAAVVLLPTLLRARERGDGIGLGDEAGTGDETRTVPTLRLGPRADGDGAVGIEEPGRHPATFGSPEGITRVRASLPGYRSAYALLGPGEVEIAFFSARTGQLAPLRVDWAFVTDDGARETGPGTSIAPALVVEPTTRDVALTVPDHLVGLTGTHRSRRRGEGDDLHDLAPFGPGDRLRAIDWRATARRGTTDPRVGMQLWVRRRLADAEAVVVIVLDSRDDVGMDMRTWAGGTTPLVHESTSLDLARQAAASYARSYLAAGDRVGFTDLAVRQRPVRPGAGGRHLARILRSIVLSAPRGEPARLVRPPQVTAGALVVVVSTFLDADAAVAARAWHEAGHPVIAVDVLPDVHPGRLDAAERTAARVILAERAARMLALRATGVRVVEWARAEQIRAGAAR